MARTTRGVGSWLWARTCPQPVSPTDVHLSHTDHVNGPTGVTTPLPDTVPHPSCHPCSTCCVAGAKGTPRWAGCRRVRNHTSGGSGHVYNALVSRQYASCVCHIQQVGCLHACAIGGDSAAAWANGGWGKWPLPAAAAEVVCAPGTCGGGGAAVWGSGGPGSRAWCPHHSPAPCPAWGALSPAGLPGSSMPLDAAFAPDVLTTGHPVDVSGGSGYRTTRHQRGVFKAVRIGSCLSARLSVKGMWSILIPGVSWLSSWDFTGFVLAWAPRNLIMGLRTCT